MLSKLEERLTVDGRRYDLSTNQYSGAVYPQGYMHLGSFRLDPFPISTFFADDIQIEKIVFMVQGENTTLVQYRVRNGFSSSPVPCGGSGRNLDFESHQTNGLVGARTNSFVKSDPGFVLVPDMPVDRGPTRSLADFYQSFHQLFTYTLTAV